MTNKKHEERLTSLYEIAYMYYCLDMSQQEIAKRTFLSRPHISRLLKQAKSEGVVTITLNFHGERSRFTETALKAEFGLAEVYVYNCKDLPEDRALEVMCRYAAKHVQPMLHAGLSVGITRGSIIAGMIQAFQPERKLDLRIVQLMGTESGADNYRNTSPDLIRRMVDSFGGATVYIDAPLYVENDFVRENLVKEPVMRKKLADVDNVGLVLTSIPRLHRGMANHIWNGFIDDSQIDDLIAQGAVGYILGRAFNADGAVLDHPVNSRIIGLHPEKLRLRNTVGVSFGRDYAAAVLGALRGGYIRTLITDFACANEVLSLAGAHA